MRGFHCHACHMWGFANNSKCWKWVLTSTTRCSRLQNIMKPRVFSCRVGGHSTPFILAVIYRPGSSGVTDQFFTELSTLLESLSTFNCGINMLVGDLNIHLERDADADKLKFERLIDGFNMRQFVTNPTHELGGSRGPRSRGPCRYCSVWHCGDRVGAFRP